MPSSSSAAHITLGTYGPPLVNVPFVLSPAEVATHKHVIGLTGQGKSKLLASMYAQLINQGVGCALVDPHADLAADVLGILADTGFFRRKDAFERLIYVDFSDKQRFLPFNVLDQPYDDHTVAKNIVEACKRAWPALADGSAPQFENILLAGSFALIQNKRPLSELPKLLTEQEYRDHLLANVSDQAIVDFFHSRFDKWGSRDAAAMIESTLRRAFLLTFTPTLRYTLGQPTNALNFRELMDNGTSVLFNLGGLDEDTQRLLGCLITVGFEVAALSRADQPEHARRHYHLFLDEFSMFSAQSEQALARVLSLARKYGLYLTLAHQTWSQISGRLHGALQNAVEISFKLGRSDAQATAPRFAKFDPYAIKHEVIDPVQADRSHPIFFSIQEQLETWTQTLVDLQPREAYVKTARQAGKIKSLAIPTTRATHQEIQAIIKQYGDRLLVPKAKLEPERRAPVLASPPITTREVALPDSHALDTVLPAHVAVAVQPPVRSNDSEPRWISVRYPAACHSCRTKLTLGEKALYFPRTRRLRCADCGARLQEQP